MKNPINKETEGSVEILDGKQAIVFPAAPDDCEYVRFVDLETDEELLYYDCREWEDEPVVVMGCIMAALQNGADLSTI